MVKRTSLIASSRGQLFACYCNSPVVCNLFHLRVPNKFHMEAWTSLEILDAVCGPPGVRGQQVKNHCNSPKIAGLPFLPGCTDGLSYTTSIRHSGGRQPPSCLTQQGLNWESPEIKASADTAWAKGLKLFSWRQQSYPLRTEHRGNPVTHTGQWVTHTHSLNCCNKVKHKDQNV